MLPHPLWKRMAGVSLLVLLSASACTTGQTQPKVSTEPTTTPSLESVVVVNGLSFAEVEQDLGTQHAANGTMDARFGFVNRDTQPVTIHTVETFCACLEAKLEVPGQVTLTSSDLPWTIQPDTVGTVLLVLDLSEFGEPAEPVSYTRLARLSFSDAVTAAFDLKLNFQISST